MWRELGIKGSLTMECSYCSGENKKVKFYKYKLQLYINMVNLQKMTTTMLQNIGRNLITALANIAFRASSNAKNVPDL